MLCPKCGHKNEDSNQFCGKCGEKLVSDNESGTQKCTKCGNEFDKELNYCPACGTKAEIVGRPKNKLFAAAACAAAITVVISVLALNRDKNISDISETASETISAVSAQNSPKGSSETEAAEDSTVVIDPEDFCSVEFSGYSGYASGRLIVNADAFAYILEDEKYHIPNSGKLKAINIINDMTGSVSSSSVKNGDMVTVKLKYDSAALSEIGIKLSEDQISLKASGIEKLNSIDPFDKVYLYTKGLSGSASVDRVDTSESPYKWLLDSYCKFTYEVTKSSTAGLSNGDIVTLKINYDKEDLLESGYEFSKQSAQYVISSCYVPLAYDKINYMDLSGLKSALLDEAYDVLNDVTVRSLEPYAYFYLPAFPNAYVYNQTHRGDMHNAHAAGLFTGKNGKGRDVFVVACVNEVYGTNNGNYVYERDLISGGYYGTSRRNVQVNGEGSPDTVYSRCIDYLEGFGRGFTLVEKVSVGSLVKATDTIVITEDSNDYVDADFGVVFNNNDYALMTIADYLKANDDFIRDYPEYSSISTDELVKHIRSQSFYDCTYFYKGYLYITSAGEFKETVYAEIPCGELSRFFSDKVAYYYIHDYAD